MTKKYLAYYKSPVGILEIMSLEDSIISIIYVEKEVKKVDNISILNKTIKQLDEYFEGERKNFDIKISFKGTAFQQKVWNELMNIPFGNTISYRELANRIGNEKAIRAVGNANGKNKINIIVPCHRVIGSNGSLTGYSGGINNKEWLLNHESCL